MRIQHPSIRGSALLLLLPSMLTLFSWSSPGSSSFQSLPTSSSSSQSLLFVGATVASSTSSLRASSGSSFLDLLTSSTSTSKYSPSSPYHDLLRSKYHPQYQPGNHRRLSRLENCTCPDQVFYRSNMTMSTYLATNCTWPEMDYIAQRVHYFWDQYTAYNEILGPIEIVQSATICSVDASTQQTSRRSLRNNNNNNDDDQHLYLRRRGQDGNVQGEADVQFFGQDQRVRLLGGRFGYPPYSFGGGCNFCGPDTSDGRRNRELAVGDEAIITIRIMTDDYPEEVAYQILSLDAVVLYERPFNSFDVANAYSDRDWILTQGETYTLRLKDSYHDGWCCNYGNGHALIIDSASETVLFNISADFGSNLDTQFTVPTNNETRTLSNAEILLGDLEPAISTYISYYIQQEFHYNTSSCLYSKNPTVWMDLEETSEAVSLNPCGV